MQTDTTMFSQHIGSNQLLCLLLVNRCCCSCMPCYSTQLPAGNSAESAAATAAVAAAVPPAYCTPRTQLPPLQLLQPCCCHVGLLEGAAVAANRCRMSFLTSLPNAPGSSSKSYAAGDLAMRAVIPSSIPTACRGGTLALWSYTCSTLRISEASGALM